MPNPIKYSTTGVTLSVKKGNFYTGTGDTDKGPSSSTGYYAGITPPSGGYTIYLSRAGGDFSIYVAANDSELITITNRLASASYSTASECLVYFSTQSDKMVVSRDYENIITNGLVVYLDPSHSSGYPKSGTTLNDLSGNSNNSTLVNGPTYSTNNSGLIVLDGTNDYITIPGNATTYTSNFTWQSFHYIRSANANDLDGMWWSEQSGKNFLMGYRNTGIVNTYFRIDSATTVYQSPSVGTQTNGFGVNAGPVTGQWIFTTIVKNGTTFTLYWGTTLMWTVTINDWNIGFSTQDIAFGAKAGGAFPNAMNIGSVLMYNRVLSTTEIAQNYNALKDRFITPSIVTASLTHRFDAGDTGSYSGTGNVWTNLNGPNNLQLVNSPTFVSNGTGSRFVFDGVNDYMTGSGYLTGSAAKSHTLNLVMSFAPAPGLFSRYRFFADNSNPTGYGTLQYFSGQGPGEIQISQGTTNFNATVYSSYPNQFSPLYTTAMYTFVSSNTGIDFYLNGTLLGGTTADTFVDSSFISPTRTYYLGAAGGGTSPISMSVAHMMWYSSSLTSEQITQNYNALKNRYGI